MANGGNSRELIYLPVTADIKAAVSKIASLSGKAEGEIYMEAIGAKVDPDVVAMNLQRLKLKAMADFMGIDESMIGKLMDSAKHGK